MMNRIVKQKSRGEERKEKERRVNEGTGKERK